MFCEKERAFDLFSSTYSKKGYSYFLVTAKFDEFEQLTKNEFIILSVKWKTKTKEAVLQNDVGFVLNSGNILVMVNKGSENDFMSRVSNQITTTHKGASACPEILNLNEHEMKFITHSN